MFRYRDQPGMLGRIGTTLGDAGINIVSAAVGRHPDESLDASDLEREATMIVTTDAPVTATVLDSVLALPDFFAARSVDL